MPRRMQRRTQRRTLSGRILASLPSPAILPIVYMHVALDTTSIYEKLATIPGAREITRLEWLRDALSSHIQSEPCLASDEWVLTC